jgi:isorenieratene synthase
MIEAVMDMNRRQFVILAAAACAGCSAQGGGDDAAGERVTKVVDAGPVELYAADGVYDHYRHQGFFLVQEKGRLTALSSDCTHRNCPLRALPDHTFSCRCHGSLFNKEGNVLRGPATRHLPQFPTTVNNSQHLIVQVTRLQFDEE